MATRGVGGGACPLLLFNGLGGNIELLLPFMEALGDRAVITFDIPGVGGSPLPGWPYCLREMADLAYRIVLTAGHAQVDVLGVSWGGALAQEFAHRHGAACRRLVLAATTTGVVMVPGKLRAVWGMATPRRFFDKAYMWGHVGDIYGGVFRTQPALASALLRHVRWRSPMGYYLQLLAATGWTSIHWLHHIQQPTLVMVGDDDPIVRPINGLLQARLLPHGRLWRIDCGHLFLLTRSQESAAAVNDFLR